MSLESLDDANGQLAEAVSDGAHGLFIPHYGRNQAEIMSFGYLHHGGIPPYVHDRRAHPILDVRKLFRDPHHDPAMRELTGRDDAIRFRVLSQPGAMEYVDEQAERIANLARAISAWEGLSLPKIFAAVGCAGGRHRSVVIAESIAIVLMHRHNIGTEVHHLDIRRPVVNRAAEGGER